MVFSRSPGSLLLISLGFFVARGHRLRTLRYVQEPLGSASGASWGSAMLSWAPLGPSGEPLGLSVGPSWEASGVVSGRSGGLPRPFSNVRKQTSHIYEKYMFSYMNGTTWAVREPSWGCFWSPLRASGNLLGLSGRPLGRIVSVFVDLASTTSPERPQEPARRPRGTPGEAPGGPRGAPRSSQKPPRSGSEEVRSI